MTKAEAVHQRIDELVAAGSTKADAFRQLAAEYGRPVKSLQGAYYQHAKRASGGSTKSRKRETTTADALGAAISALEAALAAIDEEIIVAGERAKEAQAEYDALTASSADRKAFIAAKIETLKA